MDRLEEKLTVHAGIPLVTMETWTDIVEKSRAPRHVFYRGSQWAGEVTKVSLVSGYPHVAAISPNFLSGSILKQTV